MRRQLHAIPIFCALLPPRGWWTSVFIYIVSLNTPWLLSTVKFCSMGHPNGDFGPPRLLQVTEILELHHRSGPLEEL